MEEKKNSVKLGRAHVRTRVFSRRRVLTEVVSLAPQGETTDEQRGKKNKKKQKYEEKKRNRQRNRPQKAFDVVSRAVCSAKVGGKKTKQNKIKRQDYPTSR